MLVNGMILMILGGNAVKIKWDFVFARDVETEAGRYVVEKSVWNFRCPLFLYTLTTAEQYILHSDPCLYIQIMNL